MSEVLGIFFAVLVGVPLFFLFLYLIARVKVVRKGTAMVVERYGKFHRRCDAGLHILIPFIDRPRVIIWRSSEVFMRNNRQMVTVSQTQITRVDLRENVLDFPSQSIITRDNVVISVHPMLLYKLVDPVRVAYETYDLPHAVEKLVQTTLRSIIGDMGLDDTLASREEIERGLRVRIKNICMNWGLEIKSVELLEITPTDTVQAAMHQQLAAERIRRAGIVTAEGYRERLRTEAEGSAQSTVAIATGDQRVAKILAKGQADARRLVANAEAQSVNIIGEALQEFGINPTHYIVGIKYIETLSSIACQASKRILYMPFETDVVGSVADLGKSSS